jgi:hypothetical protein
MPRAVTLQEGKLRRFEVRARATVKPPISGLLTATADGRLVGSLQRPTVFHDTTHAGTRRQERQLSVEQMKGAVCQHERRIQHRRGEHGGFVYEFRQRVVEKHWWWLLKSKNMSAG